MRFSEGAAGLLVCENFDTMHYHAIKNIQELPVAIGVHHGPSQYMSTRGLLRLVRHRGVGAATCPLIDCCK